MIESGEYGGGLSNWMKANQSRNVLLDPIVEEEKEENVNHVNKISRRPISIFQDKLLHKESDSDKDTGRAKMISPGKAGTSLLPSMINPASNIPNPN